MKNKGFFSRLFAHDSVLLIISFLLAFTAWFIINANSDAENRIVVTNIPINIDLQDDSLEVFSTSSETASVEVSGNRIIIGSITAADIMVSAGQDTVIDTPGEYELSLTAKKSGVKTNYAINTASLDPTKISVFVDKPREAEFEIDNQMVYKVDDMHYASAALSDSTVSVSGPESVISKIASVAIMGTIDGEKSSEPVSITRNLIYLDEGGNEISSTYIEANVDSVVVTLAVYPVMDIKLTLNYLNQPKDAPKVTLSPSVIRVAGPQEVLDTIEDGSLLLGNFNYSDYKNEKVNIFMDLSLPTGLKNLSTDTSVNVTTDLSGYMTKQVTAKITSSLSSKQYKTEFNNSTVDILVFGPASAINELEASDVIVVADFTDNKSELDSATLSLNVPLTVTLSKEYTNCWVNGTYSAEVTVSKK